MMTRYCNLSRVGQDGAVLVEDQLVRVLADVLLHLLADRIWEFHRIDVGAGEHTALGDIGRDLQLR